MHASNLILHPLEGLRHRSRLQIYQHRLLFIEIREPLFPVPLLFCQFLLFLCSNSE